MYSHDVRGDMFSMRYDHPLHFPTFCHRTQKCLTYFYQLFAVEAGLNSSNDTLLHRRTGAFLDYAFDNSPDIFNGLPVRFWGSILRSITGHIFSMGFLAVASRSWGRMPPTSGHNRPAPKHQPKEMFGVVSLLLKVQKAY